MCSMPGQDDVVSPAGLAGEKARVLLARTPPSDFGGSPPPSGYLIDPAYRSAHQLSGGFVTPDH